MPLRQNVKQNKNEVSIERFSIECRKTKAKVITPTNHKKRKQHKGPIRIRSKARERGTIGFGFASHWLRKRR